MPDASSTASPPPGPDAGPLPPWLWVWAAALVALVPQLVGDAWRTVATFREWVIPPFGLELWLPAVFLVLLLFQNLPALVFLAGIAAALLPGRRAARIERRFGLVPLADRGGAAAEIAAFVAAEAPGLELRLNARRMAPLAFVYPLGPRRSALAVFGGLLKLWRGDRASAQAVLLHEIAHQRQGDPAIIGIGSFLAPVLKAWPFAVLGFAVAVLLLDLLLRREIEAFTLAFAVLEGTEVADAPDDAWAIMHDYLSTYLWIVQPSPLATVLGYALWSLGVVLLPTVAVWCAELTADRFTAARPESRAALLRALDAGSAAPRPASWRASWSWLIHAVSHPPRPLRRLLAARAGPTATALLIAVLFPLGFLASALLILPVAWMSATASGSTGLGVVPFVVGNLPFLLAGIRWQLLVVALVLALWPLLAPWWTRLVAGRAQPTGRSERLAVVLPGLALLAAVAALDPATPPFLGEPVKAAAPAERAPGPALAVSSRVYGFDEPVVVEVWGLDAPKQNWVAIVPWDLPPERYVDDPEWWRFTTGIADGKLEFRPRQPGVFEARLFLDWPDGGTVIRSKAKFVIDKPRP